MTDEFDSREPVAWLWREGAARRLSVCEIDPRPINAFPVYYAAPTGAAPADPELMSHDALCDALKLSGPLGREASDRIAYLSAQEDLLETAQQEAERLRQSLAEVQRPLDQQMARLNERVIAANRRADAAEALAQAMADDMDRAQP